MVARLLLLVLCAAIGYSCADDPRVAQSRSLPQKFGVLESTERREVVQTSIALTNLILGENTDFKFAPSWRLPKEEKAANLVPVYLVLLDPPGVFGPSFIPQGERAVFVDSSEVPRLPEFFGRGFSRTSEIPLAELLSLVLLHEAGHLVQKSSGQYSSNNAGNVSLNVSDNAAKTMELEADRFVGSVLGKILTGKENNEREQAAVWLTIWLNVTGMSIVAKRAEDGLSRDPMPPIVYMDEGYSHPNLEYRVLVTLAEIDPKRFGPMVEDYRSKRRAAESSLLPR